MQVLKDLIWSSAEMPTRYGRYNHANLYQIIYANNMFVIAAESDSIFQSTNGKNWQTAEGVSGSVNLNQVTYSAPEFKASGVDDSGKESAWYSTNGLNWDRSPFPFLYVKDDAGYDILGVCTLNKSNITKCSYNGASLGRHQTIGKYLQPADGLKKGDGICVSAVTGTGTTTDFYFELQEDATSLANTTVIWTEGSIFNAHTENVSGLKLIKTKEIQDTSCNDYPKQHR